MDEFNGPHFDAGLIGPNGRLSRLHKGSAPVQPYVPPPPPVPKSTDAAESAAQVTNDQRRLRGSYNRSFLAPAKGMGTNNNSQARSFLG